MGVIKVNFRGGIISPGDLYNILVAANKEGIRDVRFGLRQQLFIEAAYDETIKQLEKAIRSLGIRCEVNADDYPNIVSSYPAEDVFISSNWLREGVYKDLFNEMDEEPQLKINISNQQQSFTPLLTGNINWIASAQQHYWHLLIRFPKTNNVFEWKDLVYTSDVAGMTRKIEKVILTAKGDFYNNAGAAGESLYRQVMVEAFHTKPANAKLELPMFNLPYYEGLNQYDGKYWLGIYRRDEWFSIELLKDICRLCLQLKIGEICSTPWKSLIIKGIEEKDRILWSHLLSRHQVNIRHAANELNFQVEDNCKAGLRLKSFLVKQLNKDDARTFGLCIGIKTRKKSEVFSSILVKRRPLLSIGNRGWLFVYDILIAKDYNPNERTAVVYSKGNPIALVPEQLRRAIMRFYQQPVVQPSSGMRSGLRPEKKLHPVPVLKQYQCRHCLTIYDEAIGDTDKGFDRGTTFDRLPQTYCCPLCEADKEDFVMVVQK